MHFKTQIIETTSRPAHGPFPPKPAAPDGTLSRRELRRIIAEILG